MPTVAELSAGPLLIFICMGLILFGIFVAQMYFYWINYENDSRGLKTFVWFVAFLEFCHTIFCIASLYQYLIVHFGDADNGIDKPDWSMLATIPPEIVIVVMTQALYTWRIWQLSNFSYWAAGVPGFFVLARFCFGIVGFKFLCVFNSWEEFLFHPEAQAVMNTIFSLELTTDAIIGGLLVYYLYHRRTKARSTNAMIQRLMVYSINSGAITIVFAAGYLTLYNVLKKSLAFMGILQMMSKMYANTMLAMLNARQTIKREGGKIRAVDVPTRGTRIQIYTQTDIAQDTMLPAVTGETMQLSRIESGKESMNDSDAKTGEAYTIV